MRVCYGGKCVYPQYCRLYYHRTSEHPNNPSTPQSATGIWYCQWASTDMLLGTVHITGRNTAQRGFILPETLVLAGARARRRCHYSLCTRVSAGMKPTLGRECTGPQRTSVTVALHISCNLDQADPASNHTRPRVRDDNLLRKP